MQVSEIMKTDLKTASADGTFADVARLLNANGISSTIVMDGNRLAGIVTERDVVNLVAEGLDPRTANVGERMTKGRLETVGPRTDIAEAAELMAECKVRHLPVIDHEKVVGIISIRDLIGWAVEEMSGEHELPDLPRSHATLSAAAKIERTT